MFSLHAVPFIVLAFAVLIAWNLPFGRDLHVPVFLLPWFALTPDIGASVPLAKFVCLLLVIKYALHGRLDLARIPHAGLILVVFLLGFGSAAITFATHQNEIHYAGGELRNGWFRVAVVSINFLLTLSPLALVFASNVQFSLPALLRGYVVSIAILCVIGVIQYLIYRKTGEDILPIGLFAGSEDELKSGLLTVGDQVDLRPGSLCGEPKNLGMYAASATVLLVAVGRSMFRARLMVPILIALMLGTIYLTQSTSAFLSLGIALVVFLGLRVIGRPLGTTAIFFLYLSTAFALLYVFFDRVDSMKDVVLDREKFVYGQSAIERLYRRSIGRIEVEDFDWVIIKSMLADPISVLQGRGFGLGHLFTGRFIPQLWLHYMEGRIVFPKSGATFLLVNGGIVTVIAMMAFLARLTPAIRHRSAAASPALIDYVKRSQLVVIPLMLLLLLRIYIFDTALFITALFAAALSASLAAASDTSSTGRKQRIVPSFGPTRWSPAWRPRSPSSR